jgi:hypothetical protein
MLGYAYTSRTASWTGELNQIGGAKTITSGGITVDGVNLLFSIVAPLMYMAHCTGNLSK